MLTFEGFTGINNVIPERRQSKSDLVQAVNVDIGLTNEIKRRDGYTQESETCHKNLWPADGFMLATCGSDLTAIHPNGDRRVVHPGLGSSRVWYCNLPDGTTTYTNGLIQGLTDGRTGTDRSPPTPELLGAPSSVHGGLIAGDYRYYLTFIRLSDEWEGPATSSEPVSLRQGGFRLDDLEVRDGYATAVYLSGKDGEGAYLAGITTGRTFEFTGKNSELTLPCRSVGAMAFPIGTVTAFWRGRVLTAQGDTLWASRHMAPHLGDWRDFKRFSAPITAVQPVRDGIYVGTEEDLVFLSGSTWDELTYNATKRGPVVLGSGVSAPGHMLMLGDGVGNGEAMVCIAGGEVVAGFAGGTTASLTQDRFRTEVREVAATFRVYNEIPQYMAVPQ